MHALPVKSVYTYHSLFGVSSNKLTDTITRKHSGDKEKSLHFISHHHVTNCTDKTNQPNLEPNMKQITHIKTSVPKVFCKSKGTTITSSWMISAEHCSISRSRFYSACKLYFWTSYFSAALLSRSVLWTHIYTTVLILRKDKECTSCSSFRTFFPLAEIKTSFLNSVLKIGFISKSYKEKKPREIKIWEAPRATVSIIQVTGCCSRGHLKKL